MFLKYPCTHFPTITPDNRQHTLISCMLKSYVDNFLFHHLLVIKCIIYLDIFAPIASSDKDVIYKSTNKYPEWYWNRLLHHVNISCSAVNIEFTAITARPISCLCRPVVWSEIRHTLKSELFLLQSNNVTYTLGQCFPNFFLADPFCLRKITTDPHILAHVNMKYPDDRYPKLKIFISEVILDSYEYIPAAYVTVHCMIWP
jgi:hypothetical protein